MPVRDPDLVINVWFSEAGIHAEFEADGIRANWIVRDFKDNHPIKDSVRRLMELMWAMVHDEFRRDW